MKISLLAALLVALMEVQAFGAVVKFDKKVNPGKLRKELEAASFLVENLRCDGSACTLILAASEKKSPSAIIAAHVSIDPELERRRERAELRSLAEKWKAGTITGPEKDHLILRFILRGLSESQ